MRYLALLRGINVGGNNLISMAELRRCLSDAGFTNITTYIQSGNVLFDSLARDPESIAKNIESLLSERFGYLAQILLLGADQLERVIDEAPNNFGCEPATCRYDVIFVRPPLRAREILPTLQLKEGVDEASSGDHAIYCWRLISKATQSRLSKLVAHPAYKSMTIRNWNTTSKLFALIKA